MLLLNTFLLLMINTTSLLHTQNISNLISEIRFQGLKISKKNDLLSSIQLRQGDTFTEERLNRAIKDLYAMQRFQTVSVDVTNTSVGVILTFIVSEESLIDRIIFEGVSRFKSGKLKDEIDMKPGVAFREARVRAAMFAIKQYYHKDGFLEAQVTYRLEPIKQLPGQFDLIFEIQEGPKIVVQDIIITGNNSFKDSKIKTIMRTKPKLWIFRSGILKEDDFLQDKDIIIGFYNQNGYMDAKIVKFSWGVENILKTNKKGEVKTSTKGIVLRIEIDEGKQYKTGLFSFVDNTIFSDAELEKTITLKENTIYNKTMVERSRADIYKMYADRGYLFANISAIQEKKNDYIIDTVFVIYEGSRAHIENIGLRGNTKTFPSVIRRYIHIKEGELYINKKLEQSFNRLMQTQFFSNVQIEPSPGSSDGLVNVDFVVSEAQTGMIEFLVGYGTVSGFSGGIKLSEKNLAGKGLQLSIRGEYGQYRQVGEITFTEPSIFNSPFSISFILGVFNNIYVDMPTDDNKDGFIDGTDFDWISNQNQVLNSYTSSKQYSRLSFRVGLATGVQFWVYWNANLGYEINIFRDWKENFSIPLKFDGEWQVDSSLMDSLASGKTSWTLQSTLYTTLRFNNTDGGLWPTKGVNMATFLSFSGGALGGDIHFINMTYAFDAYWRPFWKFTLAFHYDMGFLFPETGDKFVYRDANLMYFDGVYKMRGWLRYLAKGEATSYFSIETRIPIWSFIGAVGFWDYGAIFANYQDFTWNQPEYIMSFGLGLAVNLPVLPIRLYAARPVEWNNQAGMFKLANNDSFWKAWEFVFSIQGLF